MRITGYRILTTVQEWGRPVGDANGVFADGVTSVPIILVDTDEGITGVGFGPHVEIESMFAAVDGEDPRSVTALYDRMLRQTFKAGHAGQVFGTILAHCPEALRKAPPSEFPGLSEPVRASECQ